MATTMTNKDQMTSTKRQSTTKRGYGYGRHVVPRENLLYNHVDGTECEYCAEPMYRDKSRNFDGEPLHADHLYADKTHPPRRLIHATCNRRMNGKTKWVEHGPEWYAKKGQQEPGDQLDWPGGTPITW